MRSSFSKVMQIACVTTFFQLSVQAQNPAIPQTQLAQLSPSSGVTSSTSESSDISKPGKPTLNGQVALASEKASPNPYATLAFPVLRPKSALVFKEASEKALDEAASRAVSDASPGAEARAAIVEPKLWLKNPSIRLRVNPSESKFNAHPFASPSLEILGPRSSFEATAYALYGHTASGVYVRRGVIAADPRVIPLGSVVQISTPGYSGIYTVQDTGGKIKGKIVDLWMASSREARIFGRRQIKLQVLRWGPAKKKRGSKIKG